jgi:group I intron endonuclease
MKTTGIYKIQSVIKPERVYVGSAVNIGHRWTNHLADLRKNKHASIKLQRHFNKYGEIDLQFSVLLGCEKEDLLKVEQYFIDSYNPYFNTCKIAGSSLGVKHSEETRKKLKGKKPWNKGMKTPIEVREKQSAAKMGVKRGPVSEETRKRMSKAALGIKPSMDARIKMSEAGKRVWQTKKSKAA